MSDHVVKDAAPSDAEAEDDPQEPDCRQGTRRDVSKPEGDYKDSANPRRQDADTSHRKDGPQG
jgi:hypothetical protein